MQAIGQSARAAARILSSASTGQKNQALRAIARAIESNAGALLKGNTLDLKRSQSAGLDAALLDRLELNRARIEGLRDGVAQERVDCLANAPGCGEIGVSQ